MASGVLPEHDPEILVSAAADAGFKAVGLRIDGQSWDKGRIARLKDRICTTGLIVLDAEVLWIQPGPSDPRLLTLADVAIELGARNLLVVSSDSDHSSCIKKFREICAHAGGTDLQVSLEFGYFSKVHTLAAALAIVTAADCANARILVDPLHLSRSHDSVSDLATISPHFFSYAQFCDASNVAPDTADFSAIREEALDGRLLPGLGSLPLEALLTALPPALPLSVELRSKALREAFPEPVDRASHVLAQTQLWLEARNLA